MYLFHQKIIPLSSLFSWYQLHFAYEIIKGFPGKFQAAEVVIKGTVGQQGAAMSGGIPANVSNQFDLAF